MEYVYNDGGRSQYYKADKVGDCVCRAIAIAAQKDYKEVYKTIKEVTKENPRNGLSKRATKKICEHYGGKWVATMKIGSGCKVHLTDGELPKSIFNKYGIRALSDCLCVKVRTRTEYFID